MRDVRCLVRGCVDAGPETGALVSGLSADAQPTDRMGTETQMSTMRVRPTESQPGKGKRTMRFELDTDELRRQMQLLAPDQLVQAARYAADVRDVAARYEQWTFAWAYNEFAIAAAETHESLTRLGAEVDDAGNPFEAVGPPELPGEESPTG